MLRSGTAGEKFCPVIGSKTRVGDMLALLGKEAKLREERTRTQGQFQVQGLMKMHVVHFHQNA